MRNAARHPPPAPKPKAKTEGPGRAPAEEPPPKKQDPALALAHARASAAATAGGDGGGGYFRAPDGAVQALARSTAGGAVGAARIHTDAHAAAGARQLDAAAVTVGRDVYFGAQQYAPGTAEGDRLLRHELAHVGQFQGPAPALSGAGPLQVAGEHHPAERAASQGALGAFRTASPVAFRAPKFAPTKVARKKRAEILGPPAPGLKLEEFLTYVEAQADWFRDSTLSSKDRDDLWALLLRNEKGSHIRAGLGDIPVADLLGVAPGDWPALEAFCRGADSTGDTVRIHAVTTYTLADRKDHGNMLLELEALFTAPVCHLTISESQLKDVQATPGLLKLLQDYKADFQPHLQGTSGYSPSTPGGKGPEFEKMLALLKTAGAAGMAGLKVLATDHWVRNAHRFSFDALKQLVVNLGDTGGARKLVLVLHTGHDAAAFQKAAPLFDDLIVGSKALNNVLMIEGPDSLRAVTTRLPTIASTWGAKTGFFNMGPRRISQVIIAGHGEARSVQMAGTGAPTVSGGNINYGKVESLDLDGNKKETEDLMHALFANMDPKTARLVFAGCLVGSTKVPFGTAPGAMAPFFGSESLGAWTEREGTAAGMPKNFTKAARADVGLAAATGLFDPGTGDVGMQYAFDPLAFLGSAEDYAKGGREPTGVLRAAVEVGVKKSPVDAEKALRARLALPPKGGWYDDVTRAWCTVVLDGVAPGAGINLQKANDLANAGGNVFLTRWPKSFGVTVAHINQFNTLAFAADAYKELEKIPDYTGVPDDDTKQMRLILEQARLKLTGAPRVPNLLASILTTGLKADAFSFLLEPAALSPHGPALLPTGGPPTTEQLRLGFAWFFRDPANADVRKFLTAQVTPGATPAFNAAAAAECPTGKERNVLEGLGLITPTAPPPLGSVTPGLPLANVQVPGSVKNTQRVEGKRYEAKVLPAVGKHGLFVRRGPGMGFAPFDIVKVGDTVRVQGFTGDWAAIDHHGKLGYVFKGTAADPFIDPPPP